MFLNVTDAWEIVCMVGSHSTHKGDYFMNVPSLIGIHIAKKTLLQHKAPPTWPFVTWFHSRGSRIDTELCSVSRTGWRVQNKKGFFLPGKLLLIGKCTYLLTQELGLHHVCLLLRTGHARVVWQTNQVPIFAARRGLSGLLKWSSLASYI